MSIAEILYRLSCIARADIGDFFDAQGRFDLERAMQQSFVIKRLRIKETKKRRVVTLELHDKQKALILLAKYHRLL